MKIFYTNKKLADGIHEFLYFYSLIILKIRRKVVCESASLLLKGHVHRNRSLQYSSSDEQGMHHYYIQLIYLLQVHSTVILVIRKIDNEYFLLKSENTIKFENLFLLAQLF
jgi:hypothetical protein